MEDGLGTYSIEVDPSEKVDEGEWKCVATWEHNYKQISTCHVSMISKRFYYEIHFHYIQMVLERKR